jgi:hypothetical protein
VTFVPAFGLEVGLLRISVSGSDILTRPEGGDVFALVETGGSSTWPSGTEVAEYDSACRIAGTPHCNTMNEYLF